MIKPGCINHKNKNYRWHILINNLLNFIKINFQHIVCCLIITVSDTLCADINR